MTSQEVASFLYYTAIHAPYQSQCKSDAWALIYYQNDLFNISIQKIADDLYIQTKQWDSWLPILYLQAVLYKLREVYYSEHAHKSFVSIILSNPATSCMLAPSVMI